MPNKPEIVAHIAANTEIIQHLSDVGKIYGPIFILFIGLLIWAWRKMEHTQEKMELTFIAHIKENDDLFDKLFDNMRASDAKLNELLGEHKVNMHNGGK